MTYRDAEQVLRLSKRWQGLFVSGAGACPYGHRIHQGREWLVEDTFRCQHRPQQHHAPCNALVFVLSEWHARDGSDVHLYFAVEVTREEIEQMRRRRMSTVEKMRYLGVAWREIEPTTLSA